MLRKLLQLRAGGGEVTLSDVPAPERGVTGRLYLAASLGPMQIVASLDRDQAEQLAAVVGEWLADQDDRPAPASLVAGAIGRGRLDASTVQNCTVPRPYLVPDQREPADGQRAPV